MYLLPSNGTFTLLLPLMGGGSFSCFTQPRGFRDIFLYHYFWSLFVVLYYLPLPHNHVSRRPISTPYQHSVSTLTLPDTSPVPPRTFSANQQSQISGLQYHHIPSFPSELSASLFQLRPCVGKTTPSLQVHTLTLSLDRHFRHYASLFQYTFHLLT